jgi:hypothetical protein
MNARSRKSPQTISKATRSTTSSRASASGVTPCVRLDGRMILPFGPEVVPASRSAQQGSGKEPQTNGTSGRNGSGLSASRDLSASLANRLALRCLTAGSTLFAMGWSRVVTPSGRVISRLAASGRRTSGSDCTSWPTPVSNDDNKSVEAHLEMKKRMGGNRTAITSLQVSSQLASWPSPMAGTPAQNGYNEAGNNDSSRKTVALVSAWPTPKTPTGGPESAERKRQLGRRSGGGDLAAVAEMATWATPRAEDAESAGMRHNRGAADTLSAQAGQDSGPTSAGTTAATESTGRFLLNPRFSLWLQGLPEEWASCGERVMRSARRKPSRSSKATSK